MLLLQEHKGNNIASLQGNNRSCGKKRKTEDISKKEDVAILIGYVASDE